MDIQKEREVLQRLINEMNDVTNTWSVEQMVTHVWEQAKAQTDQKIKLLLCDEHLKKCESPTGIFNSQYPDEEPCLICLAKEAKAQAVPEGFVLVPKEPTPKMIDSTWDYFEDIEGMSHNKRNEFIYKAIIEAQESAND